MGTQQNVELVTKFLRGFATKDFEGLYAMFADGAAISNSRTAAPATVEERRVVLQRHKRLHELVIGPMPNGLVITPFSIVAQDDKVCVEARGAGETPSGKPYTNAYHFAFEVRDGKIHAMREYLDTLYLATVFTELEQARAQVAAEFGG